MKTIRNVLIGFLATVVFLVGGARASFFGEENVVLSKILLEDVQQTLKLENIMSFAGRELQTLNEKYGYERWINKGLDQVKDYGILSQIRTDDFILSTIQNDFGELGLYINQDDYKLSNVEDWVDQVWGKAPEIVNVETEYPGTLSEWMFQADNNLPGTYTGYTALSNMVNRKSAISSYKHAMYNMSFNQKLKNQMQDLFYDAQNSNPGEASRIAAQSDTLQNVQLSQINDTQSSLLKLMAEKQLNKMRDEDVKSLSMANTFMGIKGLFRSVPTLGE